MKRLSKWLKKYQGAKILDVGSGNGAFVNIMGSLYDGYDSIIGIDLLPISVDTSNKNFADHDRISFLEMDVLDMDFADHTFDIVSLSNTFHHLEEVGDTLHEMERVCKKDGILIINEMIREPLNERQVSHRMMHHFAAEIDRARGLYHDFTYTAEETLKLVEKYCNFKIKDAWDMKTPIAQDNSEEEINWLLGTIDRVLSRVKAHEKYEYFKEKATKTKDYIREHGFESATSLVVVLGQ